LKYRKAVRFVSSKGENLQLVEDCSSTDQFDRRCSIFASNVWLPAGAHPTISGVQLVEVSIRSLKNNYYFDKEYCKQQRKEFIWIQKCSIEKADEEYFFVYRLHPLFNRIASSNLDSKDCRLRYCMEMQPGE